MKIIRNLFLCMLMLVSLSGCWGYVEMDDLNYASALGIDYVKDKYVISAQFLNFYNLAKLENPSEPKHVPIYVGTGEGKTIMDAFNNLYDSSQKQVKWGHVSALILSEQVLKHNLKEVIQTITRFPDIRYNIWVFGTKKPFSELFAATPIFERSAKSTILHEPTPSYKQKSIIPPITFHEFIAQLREKAVQSRIPSINLSASHWTEDGKKTNSALVNDGMYFINNNMHLEGFLTESKLLGWRWVNEKTERSLLILNQDGDRTIATLTLQNPKFHITPRIENGRFRFKLSLQVTGYIREQFKSMPLQQLRVKAEEVIKQQIQKTYLEGLRIHVDVYKLDEAAYRKNIKTWKKIQKNGEIELYPDSLSSIEIQLKLTNAGSKMFHSGRVKNSR